MNRLLRKKLLSAVLPAILLLQAVPVLAQDNGQSSESRSQAEVSPQVVSPEAQAVIDRMTDYLRGLQNFSIDATSTRDEVVAYGYKLQNVEHSELVIQRPNKLRAEITSDIRDGTIVYDGAKLVMYSPEDAAFVRVAAPASIGDLVSSLLDAGVELPMMDVLYNGVAGTLTENVRGGIWVGESVIDGAACDHLAFRQANVDWQIWVQQGSQPLPRKIVITTRYEVGDPQYQVVMKWNLKPKISASTFAFNAPSNAVEIPLVDSAAVANSDR